MKELKLTRFLDDGKHTLGYLECKDIPFYLWSLERPWKDNKRNISCIPCGEYKVQNHLSIKHGESFFIDEVRNRSEILIHKGNLVTDSRGCLLVGISVGNIKNESAVLHSAAAMQLLKRTFQDDFILKIVDK